MLTYLKNALFSKREQKSFSYPNVSTSSLFAATPTHYRDFWDIIEHAYKANPIVYRAVHLVAESVASVTWTLYQEDKVIEAHPLLQLLNRPNPYESGTEFITRMVCYRLLYGNSYVQRVGAKAQAPRELHLLRPDKVEIMRNEHGLPHSYRYHIGETERYREFFIHKVTGKSAILHSKTFDPLQSGQGIPPLHAAFSAIDQHNKACEWNHRLLSNAASPSGILIYKGDKKDVENEVEYISNALSNQRNGRPLFLVGSDYEWKTTSFTPRDMDYINAKHTAARDIALALGVPPQLLGIPGDNTYSNLKEARLGFWEQTVIPLIDHITESFNYWLIPHFASYHVSLRLAYNADKISALSPRREALWKRVNSANFLSDEEKRGMVGG